jgi:glycosyltransferase involved in cell wall biosynthesis
MEGPPDERTSMKSANEPRKKILIVKPVLPYPPDQGTRVLSFGLIRTLQQSFDVTVLTRLTDWEQAEDARELERYCSRVVVVMAPSRRSIVHRVVYKAAYTVISWLRRRSIKSLYNCPGATVRAARRLAQEDFDVIVLEYWQMYPLFDVFPADKVVLLTHDVEMLVNRQNALLERNLLRKLVKVRKWLVEQREEVFAYRKAHRVLALTERDAAAVRKIRAGRPEPDAETRPVPPDDTPNGGGEVGVLPFGLDEGAYAGAAAERNPREVLFMGELRASFNRDALDYFVRKVIPHLDDAGDLLVTVVGGDLPPHLRFFGQDPRVEVTGRVPDVRPYLERAACLVVPLRFGGGLRIRILEAMMAGTPIVCSSVAIAGMDFRPGREFLLADTPRDTATHIKRLIDDPSKAREIARNAREAVAERYSSKLQSERMLQVFQHIVANQR